MTGDAISLGWVHPRQAYLAEHDPTLASFLRHVVTVIDDAANELGADTVTPVPIGAGGVVVKMQCRHGVVAVKALADPVLLRREADGAARLSAAGLGPVLVARSGAWFATRWVDAPQVGGLLSHTSLDARAVSELLAALGGLDAQGTPFAGGHLRANAAQLLEVRRQSCLGELGLDGTTIAHATLALVEELLEGCDPRFLHTDLHPANLLDDAGHWVVLDSCPAHGPAESDAARLLMFAACDVVDRRAAVSVAAAAELDVSRLLGWAWVFACEALPIVAATYPHRRLEIDGLLRAVRRGPR